MSKAGTDLWERKQREFGPHFKVTKVAEQVPNLSLPPIGQHSKGARGKGRANDNWDSQTYPDFATKAEQKSPSVAFTKELMDDAMMAAMKKIGRITKATGNNRGQNFERMMSRVSRLMAESS